MGGKITTSPFIPLRRGIKCSPAFRRNSAFLRFINIFAQMNFSKTLFLLILVSCNSNYEAAFVFKNKNPETLTDVYISTNTGDYWESERIDVKGYSQGVINFPVTPNSYHQGFDISFNDGKNKVEKSDYSYYTKQIPTSESFMITFHGDTVWIQAFYVQK